MKPIIAQNQVVLGLGRCLNLALTGMSYRLFRSLITVAILALAVAFLVHMLGYGFLASRTQRSAWNELAQSRLLGEWATRLTQPDSPRAILLGLASEEAARAREYAAWSGSTPAQIQAMAEIAQRVLRAERELQGLAPAARAALLGDESAGDRLGQLAQTQQREMFLQRMEALKVVPPLGSTQAFVELVEQDRPRLMATAERIIEGQTRAIEQVRQISQGRTPRELFADPPPDLVASLTAAGYVLDEPLLAELREQAIRAQQVAALNQAMTSTEVRGALAREMDLDLSEVNLAATFNWMTSSSRARWFVDMLEQQKRGVGLTAEQVMDLASRHRRQQKLQAAAGNEPPQASEGLLGLPSRTQWLIALSFLVCVVGVANAMLMSVTERFAEIATMKCLGAMDRFVMMMFVIEATVQGLMGGIIGVVLGLLLALMRGLAEFGGLLFVPGQAWGSVAVSTLASIVVGIVLAALAAVGPAWVAARLAPMEAMRVE